MSALPSPVVTAPAPRRAPAVPAPRRAPVRRTPLALVPPPVRSTAPKAPFVALVLLLLGGGLVALLLLNTVLAQDAFKLNDLQRTQDALTVQEQALSRQAAFANDPSTLARRAVALGMRPAGTPRFVRPGEKLPPGATVAGGVVTIPAPHAAAPVKPAPKRATTGSKAARTTGTGTGAAGTGTAGARTTGAGTGTAAAGNGTAGAGTTRPAGTGAGTGATGTAGTTGPAR